MNAHPIVPDGVDRDHVDVVLKLLREPVRQAGKPPHRHAHREVRAFDVAGADVLWVGLALDRDLANSGAVGGAVSTLTLPL